MECYFKQSEDSKKQSKLIELNKKLDVINEKIKNIGDPVTHSDVEKIRKLDRKSKLIKLMIEEIEK
jgi:hypothetical protein